MSSPGWYPPQWTQGTTSTVSLLVPAQNQAGADSSQPAQPTLYVFDAAVRAEDDEEIEITQNPVQTGASISDHAYLIPVRLVVEFLMSDSMQSYVAGQFSGNSSRSVAAYQTLLDIKNSFALIQVSTRLKQYSNMLIKRVSAIEDVTTRFAGKFTVVFQQVLTANVEITQISLTFPDSDRPDATDQVSSGPTSTTAPSQAIIQQNNVTNPASAAPQSVLQSGSTVPNAGVWSSTNASGLGQFGNSIGP